MNNLKIVSIVLPLAAILCVSAAAQEEASFQYAVKFICGRDVTGRVLRPGIYATAINVHNPSRKEVRFQKKFAIALPREKPGKVTQWIKAGLGPDEAFEVDCPDILEHVGRMIFVKGFAVIESSMELDIVAVYTAGADRVETLHIERVQARRSGGGGGQPDLVPVRGCNRTPAGLIIAVQNQGTGDAGPSTTLVSFASGGTVNIPTPPIAAGGSVNLPPVPIPPNCFRPDCSFKVTVDANNQVNESDEGNNTITNNCLG